MSWKTLNQVLALACIDQAFWLALREDPLVTLKDHGFELSPDEQAIIYKCGSTANDLAEFCQCLLKEFDPEQSGRGI